MVLRNDIRNACRQQILDGGYAALVAPDSKSDCGYADLDINSRPFIKKSVPAHPNLFVVL